MHILVLVLKPRCHSVVMLTVHNKTVDGCLSLFTATMLL